MEQLKSSIIAIIESEMNALNRHDLFRKPIVGFSSAEDERYPKLKDLIGSWHLNPREILNDANTVISYFVPFTKDVVMGPKTAKQVSPKWGETYLTINEYFNHINKTVCEYLNKKNFSATSTPPTNDFDPDTMQTPWSHRSAAVIAGLGTLGLNRMLITNKGSGGRICTIFTSATLTPNDIPLDFQCLNTKNNSCKLCIKSCPANALEINEMNKTFCYAETKKNEHILRSTQNLKGAEVCGKCISMCPLSYIE